MRSRSRAPLPVVHGLLLAGAVAMGHGGSFPLHAQESVAPAKRPGIAGEKAAGQPATAAAQAKLRVAATGHAKGQGDL